MAGAPGPDSASAGEQAWQAARAMREIQYSPLPPYNPPKADPPEWLKALFRFLARLFEPLGKWLGTGWSAVEILLALLAVAGAAWIAWTLFQRWRLARAMAAPAPSAPVIDHAAALALLEDADALAAEGRFDEAVHLLLQRSVHHIAAAQPDWLSPSSTAREISLIPGLPAAARQAFTLIAREVERSLYALRALAADDWHRAREAYAAFALQNLEGKR
ncbi:MAG: hypothetical protein K2Q27_06140 [Novosphingobium sp.]|nr:hypothetical protein [Novosphingobium sp.]MBY0392827.1 hypothetical protein [Novosphingobium sp.]